MNVNGMSNEDICVVFGSSGIWESKAVNDKIKMKPTKKLFSTKGNTLLRNMLYDDFFNDDLLVIEGNQVFDIAIISRLLRYRKPNVLVVNDLIDPDETDHAIQLDGNRVIAVNDSEIMEFPWVSFAGIARLSAEAVHALQEIVSANIPFLDAIGSILDRYNIVAISYDDLLYGRLNGGYSDELVGGSYAKLNYRLVVKKEGSGEGRNKLINEIKWLLELPAELKPYFSEVLEYDITSPEVFFNVPYYGSRNLREHIFDGHFDSDQAVSFLEKILDFMFEKVYSRKVGMAPENWVMEKHVDRVLDRLVECSEKSDVLAKIIQADEIEINGIRYRNIKEMFTQISKMKDFLKLVNPKELVMIHGDLHFQNILVYSENDRGFMLVDPRGEMNGSDLYYDMGKLWHCFHGKYDFVHSDQFRFSLSWDGNVPITSYELTNSYAVKVYDEIHKKFLKMITKYDTIKNDPYWEMKSLFAEVAHFCSVSTFHIGKTDTAERAVVLYLIGVELVNGFCEQYLSKEQWKRLGNGNEQ